MANGFVWRIWLCLMAGAFALVAGLTIATADPRPPGADYDVLDSLCIRCHGQSILSTRSGEGEERRLEAVDAEALEASAHGEIACVRCHAEQSGLPHAVRAAATADDFSETAACARCHGEAYESYLASAHGTMVHLGDVRAPGCTDCHGAAHEVRPADEWSDEQRAGACGECHSGAGTGFLDAQGHEEPSARFLPIAYFAGRFLTVLTAATLAIGIIHVELSLLRWFVQRRAGA